MMADQLLKFVREVNSLSVFADCLAASPKQTTSHGNKYIVFQTELSCVKCQPSFTNQSM